MKLEEVIRKHVLKNALDYGKAQQGGVVGKVIAEYLEAKKNMKETMQLIGKIILEVNKLSKSDIEKEMAQFTYVEKKEGEKKLVLSNAESGKVVVRFPPEPNGFPHIGHAKAFFLEWTICRQYGGKVILRWDDTNPETEKQEYVDAIRDGIKWLGMNWDEEVYCSDYLSKLYSLNEQLIKQCDAYVCSCSQGQISENREKKKRCKCTEKKPIEQLALWKQMLESKMKKGDAIVRLKCDMTSLNTVMRDPTLWRIVQAEHYRQGNKYGVWPTYDFQGPVMDSLLGITHPLRSKEYELRDELYVFLLNKLKLRVPTLVTISRLSLKNTPISKRLLKPLVESGKLWGWDDPRLPTLAGLRRRGIMPETIKKFVLSFGLSKVESNPTWEQLLSFNRKELENSPHYFFVPDQVAVKIGNETYYIPREDAAALKVGEIFRFKNGFNVKITKKGKALEGENLGKKLVENTKKLQWVDDTGVKCVLYVPGLLFNDDESFNENSLEEKQGLCQKECLQLKEGDVVQFERVGFARLDKKQKNKLEFILSS